MANILLARGQLDSGFIDASYGEPWIIKDILLKTFGIKTEFNYSNDDFSYPNTTGYKPLVALLEDKHKYPVIITTGAKQALGGVFYALNKLDKPNMYLPVPYWALIPPIANIHGVSVTQSLPYESICCVAPNNPDGICPSLEDLKIDAGFCAANQMTFIHDAAYYSHVYLPEDYELDVVGDVQIYSVSKLTGLSGLRLGYVVCKNVEFYNLIQEYIEIMTVGVSVLPQILLHDLLLCMKNCEALTKKFEKDCYNALLKSKQILKQVNPEFMDVGDIEKVNGMFGWFKLGPKADFDKAKIKVVDGALFGMPGFVRMNIAFDEVKMQEIVDRINNNCREV